MARIQLRRAEAVDWESINPVLLEGEIAVDLTTGGLKIGDGQSTWTELVYLVGGEEGGTIDFPVDSVNGQTGDVTITLASLNGSPIGHTHTAAEVGAAAVDHTHAPADIGAATVNHTHTAAQVGAIPAGDITAITKLTQAAYDAIVTKSATTLYVITEA